MSARKKGLIFLLHLLSSSRLALILVVMVIIFSVVGAVLPQRGMVTDEGIEIWQKSNPMATKILRPLGFFQVFVSWPFMITIIAFAVNTLTCTILRFLRDGGFSSLKGPGSVERLGFLVLHLSLILLFFGSFVGAATKLDGFIILTRGQAFTGHRQQYQRIIEGPLRNKEPGQFAALMTDLKIKYEKGKYAVDIASSFDVYRENKLVAKGTARVNKPFVFEGYAFTLDQNGYSPHISIKEKLTAKQIFNSFVALKTFDDGQQRQYSDFLPLPFLKNMVILTIYPSYERKDGKAIKTSESVENPLIIVEVQDQSGKIISRTELPIYREITVGEHTLEFKDLRQWVSFRVVQDKGYPIVWISLWLGVAGLVLRYLPDLIKKTSSPEPESEMKQ
ncbi:MAG: cytochrome c biogenesis protein ResB [Planctomycetota bacterium]|jgi:cytochrome c biogenesis protein ResB